MNIDDERAAILRWVRGFVFLRALVANSETLKLAISGEDDEDREGTVPYGGDGPLSMFLGVFAAIRSLVRALILGPPASSLRRDSTRWRDAPSLESRPVTLHDLTPFIDPGPDRPFAISPCSDLYKARLVGKVLVAVRRVRFQDDIASGESRLRDAAGVLVGARHANVLCYIGTCDFQGSLCIVSTFAGGGDLKKHIAAHPDCDRRRLLLEVAQGLLYLHQSAIVHGNLHPRNVLLTKDGTVKVSDFGLAEIIPDEGSTSMRPVFAREKAMHRAPETHIGGALSPPSDVYSLGMLIFHAYCDKEPMIERYPGVLQVVSALMAEHRPLRSEVSRSDFSDSLWGLIQRCWSHAKEQRLAMADVVKDLSTDMPERCTTM